MKSINKIDKRIVGDKHTNFTVGNISTYFHRKEVKIQRNG